jgi:hypothetical protein
LIASSGIDTSISFLRAGIGTISNPGQIFDE